MPTSFKKMKKKRKNSFIFHLLRRTLKMRAKVYQICGNFLSASWSNLAEENKMRNSSKLTGVLKKLLKEVCPSQSIGKKEKWTGAHCDCNSDRNWSKVSGITPELRNKRSFDGICPQPPTPPPPLIYFII